MKQLSIVFLFSLNTFLLAALPSPLGFNTNGIRMLKTLKPNTYEFLSVLYTVLVTNGKGSDEFTCKTDDGKCKIIPYNCILKNNSCTYF